MAFSAAEVGGRSQRRLPRQPHQTLAFMLSTRRSPDQERLDHLIAEVSAGASEADAAGQPSLKMRALAEPARPPRTRRPGFRDGDGARGRERARRDLNSAVCGSENSVGCAALPRLLPPHSRHAPPHDADPPRPRRPHHPALLPRARAPQHHAAIIQDRRCTHANADAQRAARRRGARALAGADDRRAAARQGGVAERRLRASGRVGAAAGRAARDRADLGVAGPEEARRLPYDTLVTFVRGYAYTRRLGRGVVRVPRPLPRASGGGR